MLRSIMSVEDDDHEKVYGAKLSIRCHIVFCRVDSPRIRRVLRRNSVSRTLPVVPALRKSAASNRQRCPLGGHARRMYGISDGWLTWDGLE